MCSVEPPYAPYRLTGGGRQINAQQIGLFEQQQRTPAMVRTALARASALPSKRQGARRSRYWLPKVSAAQICSSALGAGLETLTSTTPPSRNAKTSARAGSGRTHSSSLAISSRNRGAYFASRNENLTTQRTPACTVATPG